MGGDMFVCKGDIFVFVCFILEMGGVWGSEVLVVSSCKWCCVFLSQVSWMLMLYGVLFVFVAGVLRDIRRPSLVSCARVTPFWRATEMRCVQ